MAFVDAGVCMVVEGFALFEEKVGDNAGMAGHGGAWG
jgi:hypothetical protein